MNYTLNQLRIFLKVSQTLSISKAAEELHLSQPAVSIQLRNFQGQFEIPLLEVVRKKIFLTDFGKEIAVSAEQILAQIYAINYRMHTHKGALTGKLRIAVVSSGKYIAPYFVSGFIRRHEGVDLLMDVDNRTQVLRRLEKNEVDFAFVSALPENPEVHHLDLMENRLFLIGGAEANPELLQEEQIPLIYREPGSATRFKMEQFMKKNRRSFRKKLELTSSEAVKQAIMAGLGCSLMPLVGIKNELLNQELNIIPFPGLPISTRWSVIWLREKKLSPLGTAFSQYLEKEKHQIIAERFSWMERYTGALLLAD
jgi:DNA-binding transcriptional LysR family regulator